MAESQSKRRDQGYFRGNSSNGRFSHGRRGQWGHSRVSINAALAIAPTTTAPLAADDGNPMALGSNQGAQGTTSGGNGIEGILGIGQQQTKSQRHGRKRRRHRHSSFSGGDKAISSSYSLPPAVAAALAIPPKTPDTSDAGLGPFASDDGADKRADIIGAASSYQNGAGQPSSSGYAAANGSNSLASIGKRKKRRSRRKRRQWKPYYKLTAEERRELEEREEKRAERVRAQRFAHGQPVAPYNTTQFLLRDRELRNGGEPDCGNLDEIVRNIRHHTRSGSYESPGAIGASDSDGGDLTSENSDDYSYLEREFDNDWLDEQKQRLEAMTKDDLVKEFMDLQKQYESAQRDMRSKRLSYEEQISTLQRENIQLRSNFIRNEPSSASSLIVTTANAEMKSEIMPEATSSETVSDAASTITVSEPVQAPVDDSNPSPSSAATNKTVITLSIG